jgi:signal transduction histidine kinase
MAEPTVLGALIREVLEAFAPLAKARRVSVRLQLDESVVATVDRGAMRQVLINVLDNAVKYGPAGQTITVGLEACGSEPWARITVDDEGPVRRLVAGHGGRVAVGTGLIGGARFIIELPRLVPDVNIDPRSDVADVPEQTLSDSADPVGVR